MDYLFEYLIKVIPTHLLEFIAAIAGSFYLLKKNIVHENDKYLVYFLWLTLILDISGSYVAIAYFSEYKYFGIIENTVFRNNDWLYNIYSLFFYGFFIKYFIDYSFNIKIKKLLKLVLLLFLISAVFNLIFSGTFFIKSSSFTSIIGTIISIICIALFYFDLLKSDKVYKLKYYLPIYVSIGVLAFNLLVTPIDIFSAYFNKLNENYFKLKGTILLGVNIVMYSVFTLGFMICANNKDINNDIQ